MQINPAIKKMCCKNCGHVTFYKTSNKYECQKQKVDKNGVCDRYQQNVSPSVILKCIDKKIAELDKYEDGQFYLIEIAARGGGQFELKKYPPFGQNYHVISEE